MGKGIRTKSILTTHDMIIIFIIIIFIITSKYIVPQIRKNSWLIDLQLNSKIIIVFDCLYVCYYIIARIHERFVVKLGL